MGIHAAALSLVDAFAREGCPLVEGPTGIGPALRDPPAALDARLKAFVGPPDLCPGSTPRRALAAVVRAQNRAARELLTWPVALARMPEPYTVELDRKGTGIVITSHGATWHARVERQPCFVLRELDAMAALIADGRATPRTLDGWLAQKRRSPRWVLAPERMGATPDPHSAVLTFGALCDALDLQLVRVTVVTLHEVASQQGAA